MRQLDERDYTYFTTVRGMCRQCRKIVPARVFFRDERVWQESLCPTCSNQPALIASDKNWFLANVLNARPDHSPLPSAKPAKLGCPHDCGPCTWHASPCQLPVISITNACDLRCPICFTYNRIDKLYFMPVEEMRKTVKWIVESSGTVDLINITGGEPTLHPQLMNILDVCNYPGIGRITMNSNGLRLAEDLALCRELADRNVYVILSCNTLDEETSREIHGCDLTKTKLKAIDNLAKAGVRMTLLNVMIRDTNETAVQDLFRLMKEYENILSLTVQTMTYTGQGGGQFPRARHIPVDEATHFLCRHSAGMLQIEDFVSRPSAHPLCYRICYMLKKGGEFVPFTRFAPREKIEELLRDSYLIRPGRQADFFRNAINEYYAEGRTEHMGFLRELVETLYPAGTPLDDFQRQRIAESFVRTIYVHAHMDEDTFDCSRAMLCPDLVPTEPGRLIPACTYNLFYRMKDERFYAE